MNKQKLIPVLAGLLVAQLLLAAGLGLGGADRNRPQNEKLLAVDTGAVDTIRIEGGEASTELTRTGESWTVPALEFPADGDKVATLLEKLDGLKKGWPVARTGEAAGRFKVSDREFERKITLFDEGETVAELYLGTSPGLRKAHARLAGEDEIYAVEFSTHQARAGEQDWIDKAVLKRDPEAIARLELPDIVLERKDGEVVIAGLEENQQTDTEQAKQLLRKVAGLEIRSVLGREAKPEYGLDKPLHNIALTLEDGETVRYAIAKLKEKGNDYVLKSSDNDYYLRIPGYTLNSILDTEKDKLVKAADTGAPPGEEPAQPAAS